MNIAFNHMRFIPISILVCLYQPHEIYTNLNVDTCVLESERLVVNDDLLLNRSVTLDHLLKPSGLSFPPEMQKQIHHLNSWLQEFEVMNMKSLAYNGLSKTVVIMIK